MKNSTFFIVTAILVSIIGFCVAITVQGQTGNSASEKEAYYRAMEEQLLVDTKAYLADQGYSNSGVTLNRIVDAEGKREYTFTIHHSRIDKMDEAKRVDLQEQFAADNPVQHLDTFTDCTFNYEFLIL